MRALARLKGSDAVKKTLSAVDSLKTQFLLFLSVLWAFIRLSIVSLATAIIYWPSVIAALFFTALWLAPEETLNFLRMSFTADKASVILELKRFSSTTFVLSFTLALLKEIVRTLETHYSSIQPHEPDGI